MSTRLGIIGTGWGARVQVSAFREAGWEVVAIAGRDPLKTRETAARLGIERSFEDWRDMLAVNEIDLINVVTPPSEHAEMAIASLESGKHVLCEKPMALNAAEARAMLAIARAHPRQIALIDHELRFLPAWREARKRFSEIQPLRLAEIRYSSSSRGDPSRPWNWWSDASRGGGVLGAVGSHCIDSLLYFVGEIDSTRALIHTFIDTRPLDGETKKVTSDDFTSLQIEMHKGGFASLHMTVVAAVDEPTSWQFHGKKGGIRLIDDGFDMATKDGKAWEAQPCEKSPPVEGDTTGGRFGTATRHLARALKSAVDHDDRDVLKDAATFEDGLRHQIVIDAARQSHRAGGGWVGSRDEG